MADEQRELSGAVDAMKLNGEQTCNGDHQDTDTYETTWGFPRHELYKLALQFYKGTHRSFTCQMNCAEANADAEELTGYVPGCVAGTGSLASVACLTSSFCSFFVLRRWHYGGSF